MNMNKINTINCIKNHIYFKGDVTMKNMNFLCNTISKFNIHKNKFGKSPLYLHITTNGGDVYGGLMAYDYIRNSKIPIYTIAEGMCFSSGTILLMGGKKRYMLPNSYLMIHQIRSSFGDGKLCELRDDYVNTINLSNKLINIYIKHTELDKTHIEELLKKDIILDSTYCIKHKIINEIAQCKNNISFI